MFPTELHRLPFQAAMFPANTPPARENQPPAYTLLPWLVRTNAALSMPWPNAHQFVPSHRAVE